MDIVNFIQENTYILIPVIYLMGMFLKTTMIDDKYIPVLLWIAGVLLCTCIIGLNANAFIQGTLTAGCAVFFNQLYKQNKKEY